MRVQDPPGPGYHPGIESDGGSELNRSWLRRHGAALFLAFLLVFGGVTILVEVGPSGLIGFSPQSKPSVVNPRQAEFEGVCSKCHGLAGKGDYVPALSGNALVADAAAVETIVREGRRRMPAVGKDWTGAQMKALTDYLRDHVANGGVSGG